MRCFGQIAGRGPLQKVPASFQSRVSRMSEIASSTFAT